MNWPLLIHFEITNRIMYTYLNETIEEEEGVMDLKTWAATKQGWKALVESQGRIYNNMDANKTQWLITSTSIACIQSAHHMNYTWPLHQFLSFSFRFRILTALAFTHASLSLSLF